MKKFLLKLSYTVLPVFLVLFGLVAYVSLWLTPRLSGDLGSLAYIPFNIHGDGQEVVPLLFSDVQTVAELGTLHTDVLTVGDSFAQQGEIGFQQFLAATGLSVANCSRRLYDSPLQFAYGLLDAGLVDSARVRVMVVEIGERDVAARFQSFSPDKVEQPAPPSGKKASNAWSLLRARDFLMYRYGGKSPVYTVTLDRDCFDTASPRSLYFYCADILNGVSIPEAVLPVISHTFGLLSEKARERGVGLILMVPVDKYDLYQPYIVANPYPPKRVNEQLESLFPDVPGVLICKPLLVPLLERGELDVFLYDDSHWSAKASRVVGSELARRVRLLAGSSDSHQ